MSGIYIHIPYCKQACHYCDFHFSTYVKTKPRLVKAICHEISLQKNYLPNSKIDTIYFGGGTPSLLTENELGNILYELASHFNISKDAEVTLEANPDDFSCNKLQLFRSNGINRLSIGVQSFNDDFLKLFNRAHTSKMAVDAVRNSKDSGFDNISVDLIFGIPNQTLLQFHDDLKRIVDLNTEHISIYGLTIEENTAFGKWQKSGKLEHIDEEIAATQFELIMDELALAGFQQYEISNFCKPGFESKHNSNYWVHEEYLGIGPGAHSYNGFSRQFNIANNAKYIHAINVGEVPYELEVLSNTQKLNEYILTKIRTSEGLSFERIKSLFDFDFKEGFKKEITSFVKADLIVVNDNLTLTRKGKLVADSLTGSFIIN